MRRGNMCINIKQILNNTIRVICSNVTKYCENPSKDFTRSRKLPAYTLMQFMLNMEGNSLNAEIYNNFPVSKERMTASAYEQQRDKLKPDAFKALLHEFNATMTDAKTFTTNNTSVALTKLGSVSDTVYVRVRAYYKIGDITVYGGYTSVIKAKIKADKKVKGHMTVKKYR